MMSTQDLVSIDDFCSSHHIEISFIHELQDYGLIEVVHIKESNFIEVNQLPALERMMRLHYDLDINLPGIVTMQHILQRLNTMQEEMTILKNRLRRYEDD